MRNRFNTIGLSGLGLLGLLSASAGSASAAPALRVQVDQRGDAVLIGNTLGYECAAGTPAPLAGSTVGNCGTMGLNDTAPDIFWRADSPVDGQAEANNTISAAMARSSAVLTIPPGAYVTHAYLYWGARRGQAGADPDVTVSFDGGAEVGVTADDSFTATVGADNFYQSLANVTATVRANGSGSYRVSGIDVANFVNANNSNSFAGWWMAVFYELDTDPPRSLTLFDGFDVVNQANSVSKLLTGFVVPPMVMQKHKLGIIAYDGDQLLADDHLFFGGGAELTDAENPDSNFFNGTRSYLGAPATNPGDLPYLSGTAQSLASFDIDVVDVTSKLSAGQTSANIMATSTGDDFFLGGLVTSIETFRPIFTGAIKTAVDVNGGALVPGDVVEYTIVVKNTGTDKAVGVVLEDPIPAGVTYELNSLQITQGPNMGNKSDAPLLDEAEYDAVNNKVVFRLGTGATALVGGSLQVNEQTTVKFRVKVAPGTTGSVANQAIVKASGDQGAPESVIQTDGKTGTPGPQPTVVVIDECGTDADCSAPEPHCKTAVDPNICVECTLDAHCPANAPTCDTSTNTCTCIPTGAEVCDGLDNDCNGTADDGNPGGGADCPSGLPGICAEGTTACANGMLACNPNTQPGTLPDECGNMLDEDCNGIEDDCNDSDGDGLSDDEEAMIGTDPNDADSDDDGVIDGDEPSYADDSDGDGKINALDSDSDNDGLFDGTELGFDCMNPATDATKGQCVPDGDMGATKTDPLNPDTDGGGTTDSEEDKNKNGVVDAGESDPTAGHGNDDIPCTADSMCGNETSGKVCDLDPLPGVCGPGCRGVNGNGCPSGQVCSSTTEAIGTCGPAPDTFFAEGNSLFCAAKPMSEKDGNSAAWLVGLAMSACLAWRRRQRGAR